MANILYTTPDTGPLSWAATNRNVARVSNDAFERHAAAFYGRRKKKGVIKKLLNVFKKDPPERQKIQRPGFLQGSEATSKLPLIAVLAIAGLIATKALKS